MSLVQVGRIMAHPLRTKNRLLHLESQCHELFSANDQIMVDLGAAERQIKSQKKEIARLLRDRAGILKQQEAVKRWILVAHRLELPRKAGAVDELIRQRIDVPEQQSGN